jgi:hypothetical protein
MSLVFPTALAARNTNVALARGASVFGLVLLAATFVSLALIGVHRQSTVIPSALCALAVIGAAGALVSLPVARRPWVLAVAAIAALVGITAYSLVILPRLAPGDPSAALFLSLPKAAIVMFGAVASRHLLGVSGLVIAFLVAQVPVVVVTVLDDRPLSIDLAATGSFVVLLALIVLLDVASKRAHASEQTIARAERDDRLATAAERLELDSTSRVARTILAELAALAATPAGTMLSLEQRGRITTAVEAFRAPSETGEVAVAVERARTGGLDVTVNGDLAMVQVLRPEAASALALAVSEYLGAVVTHAAASELSVIATPTELCVVLVDSGDGDGDRDVAEALDGGGRTHSVRGRIAAVGGSVQVWSAPGVSTAIALMVPR